MHLPPLPAQALGPGQRGLALEDQVRGVRIAVLTALGTVDDLRVVGGDVS